VAGCGGGAHFANIHRPPTPIDLTVYINDARVSVSPASVGAGPIIFFVTNQASRTESMTIQPRSGGSSLGSTGPINPDSTTQVTVNLNQTGDYTVGTGSGSGAPASGTAIAPATLHIGPSRPNADNALLQP
jgi:hypothetical protein